MWVNWSRQADFDKAKALLCAIIEENGGRLEGMTRLYKVFYYAHLVHWHRNRGMLSEYPLVKMPKGPGIDDGDVLLNELKQEGLIESQTQQKGPYPENMYTLRGQVPNPISADEREAIRHALDWANRHPTATHLSDVTHSESRAWNLSEMGEDLDLTLDTLSDEQYSEMIRARDWADNLVDSVFGGGGVGRAR